ncbi:hypothetical protein ABPG74_010383 [Tetrahymena malaccensis]
MYINSPNMEGNNQQEKQDDIEKRKISEFKEKAQEKKRTDSRNETLNYHRKRMIQPVQIRQLSQEDFKFDEQFDDENIDYINSKIQEFKLKIVNPQSEEELWKALLIFETMSKKISSVNIKGTLSKDLNFVRQLLQQTQSPNISDECKLGTLQMLSEITESFKNLSDIGPQADQFVFEQYLRVYRLAKTEKTFATVLQAISQLTMDNIKSSEYFIHHGFYPEFLATFEKLMTANSQLYLETIKDLCIILHGLSRQQHPFDYNHEKLGKVFQYLIQTNDCDIHFDLSSAIDNIVRSYSNNNNFEWVANKFQELYNLGLMNVVLKLINQENVWIPVKGNKILSAISHIQNDKIRHDFMIQIHESGVFDQILTSIKNSQIMLVLKYHLFLTLKNLVDGGCIYSEKYNYLIQNLLDPQVIEKKQLQQQVIEVIWLVLQKEKNKNFKIEITHQLIEILCTILQDETDNDLLKKGLDIFDRVMSMSAQDANQKKHIKWLQRLGFNQIIHSLQQNKNEEICKKAVAVVSYLDSDEGSDSDSMKDESLD